MKTMLIPLLFLSSFFAFLPSTEAAPRKSTIDVLHQEISSMLSNRNLSFLDHDAEVVTIDFMINAKNEIVIVHTYGNSPAACDYVKDILNFRKVKYRQTKQLTPYVVNIRLIK